MKIDTKKLDDCRVKLTIAAGADETKPDYDKVVQNYVRNVRIRGFRPGKAPLSVIQKAYGKELNADIRAALLNRFTIEAIEHEKLDVVARVNVEDVVFSPETGISFAITLDLRPEVKLPKYKDISVKVNEITIDEEEVEHQLYHIREHMSPREDTEEPVAEGDMVEIDFVALSSKKPLAEVAPGSDRLAKSDSFWVIAEEHSESIPGVSAALQGKKTGDVFTFSTKFPKDFYIESLRGVKASYDGTVKKVRRMKPLTDEELAQAVGMESVDTIRKNIRDRMEAEKKANEDAAERELVTEWILKKTSFPLPKSIVAVYTERQLEAAIRDVTRGQADPQAYAKEHADEIQKRATEVAERQVHLSYALAAIAKEEKIDVSEQELNREIDNIARYYAAQNNDKTLTGQSLRRTLENNGNLSFLRSDLLNAKVLGRLVKQVHDNLDAKAGKKAAKKD